MQFAKGTLLRMVEMNKYCILLGRSNNINN